MEGASVDMALDMVRAACTSVHTLVRVSGDKSAQVLATVSAMVSGMASVEVLVRKWVWASALELGISLDAASDCVSGVVVRALVLVLGLSLA